MRNSGAEQFGNHLERDFGMSTLRFINSRVIWLALDENHEDSRRIRCEEPVRLEIISCRELELYHRQLFYWLLIRHGPYIFTSETRFEQGIPVGLRVRN
jgi:hypothetical protein